MLARLLDVYPQRVVWGLSYAYGYFQLGLAQKAETELLELGKNYQDLPEVINLRGLILLSQERWHKVLHLSARGRILYPHMPEFYVQGAYAFEKLKDYSQALHLWEGAPSCIRSYPLYHYNVARCQAFLGEIQGAESSLRVALTLDPKLASTIRKEACLRPCLSKLALKS